MLIVQLEKKRRKLYLRKMKTCLLSGLNFAKKILFQYISNTKRKY